MDWSQFKKYCLHGVLWSLLSIVLIIGIVFLIGFLVLIGSLMGLAIGFIVIFIAFGALNSWIDMEVWGDRTEDGWKAYLVHGLVLFLVLIAVGIPNMLLSWLIPGIWTSIILFVLFIPIDGFVAKEVAQFFEVVEVERSHQNSDSNSGVLVSEQLEGSGDYYFRH